MSPLYVGRTFLGRRWYFYCRNCHVPDWRSWPTRDEALAAALDHCQRGK